jgi:hypothetical protein
VTIRTVQRLAFRTAWQRRAALVIFTLFVVAACSENGSRLPTDVVPPENVPQEPGAPDSAPHDPLPPDSSKLYSGSVQS